MQPTAPNWVDLIFFLQKGSNTLHQGIGPPTLKTWLRPCSYFAIPNMKSWTIVVYLMLSFSLVFWHEMNTGSIHFVSLTTIQTSQLIKVFSLQPYLQWCTNLYHTWKYALTSMMLKGHLMSTVIQQYLSIFHTRGLSCERTHSENVSSSCLESGWLL